MCEGYFSPVVCRRALVGLLAVLAEVAPAWGAPPPKELTSEEDTAIQNMAAIRQAIEDYRQLGYGEAGNFQALTHTVVGPLLTCDFGVPVSGYSYSLWGAGWGETYWYYASAEPENPAWIHLYADENGMYGSYGAPATSASDPITPNTGLGTCYNEGGAAMIANYNGMTTDFCAIRTAQEDFWASHYRYAQSFPELADFLGGTDFSTARNGYLFTFETSGYAGDYGVTANPEVVGVTGMYAYSLSSDGSLSGSDWFGPVEYFCNRLESIADYDNMSRDILCALNRAEIDYRRAHGMYAASWGELTTDPVGGPPALGDPAWVEGRVIAGYVYTATLTTGSYVFAATPQTSGVLNTIYTTDKTGVIFGDGVPIEHECPEYPPFNMAREHRLFLDDAMTADFCTIWTAQEDFWAAHYQYAENFSELADYLGNTDFSISRHGYLFTIEQSGGAYTVAANPEFPDLGFWPYTLYDDGFIWNEYGGRRVWPSASNQCNPPESDADYERVARDNLCALNRAQINYWRAHGQYASSWGDLTTDPAGGPPALQDPSWTDGRVFYGYEYTGVFTSGYYTFTATPLAYWNFSAYSISETGAIIDEGGNPVEHECPAYLPFGMAREHLLDNTDRMWRDLRSILDAEHRYYADHGVFAGSFALLGPEYLEDGPWSDGVLRHDYVFTLSGPANGATFECSAVKDAWGWPSYHLDDTGVGSPGSYSPPHAEQFGTALDPLDSDTIAKDVMGSIFLAQEMFHKFYGTYAASFDELQNPSVGPSFLIGVFEGGWIGSYAFTMTGDGVTYQVQAVPGAGYYHPGQYGYFLDQTGILRARENGDATAVSPHVRHPLPEYPPYLSLRRVRMMENEEMARARLCEIFAAEEQYKASHGGQYALDSDALAPYLGPSSLRLDNAYQFAVGGTADAFFCNAVPVEMFTTGTIGYYLDASGAIRFEEGGSATESSTPLGWACTGAFDLDGDGMPDTWESENGVHDPSTDPDQDGLTALDEYLSGTDHNHIDSDYDGVLDTFGDPDGDGLANWFEAALGSHPMFGDSDGDGLNDGDEVHINGTDPAKADTDDDGMPDGWEVSYPLLDPIVNDATEDPDGDLIPNIEEYTGGTNPTVPDGSLPEGEGEGEAVTEGEGEAVTEGEGEAVAEGEGEAVTEGEGEAATEGEGEATAEGEGEGEGEPGTTRAKFLGCGVSKDGEKSHVGDGLALLGVMGVLASRRKRSGAVFPRG